jgi:hypothetical protein
MLDLRDIGRFGEFPVDGLSLIQTRCGADRLHIWRGVSRWFPLFHLSAQTPSLLARNP